MDKISKLILIFKYSKNSHMLDKLRLRYPNYSYFIDLPCLPNTNVKKELYKIEKGEKSEERKRVLFINLSLNDVNYNHMLRNCFCCFFNDRAIPNDIITYENLYNLRINFNKIFYSFFNTYWNTYYFSSIFTNQVYSLIKKMIKNNNYDKIIIHSEWYFLHKLILSDLFWIIKDKLIVISTHLWWSENDFRDLNIIKYDLYKSRIKKINKYYGPWDLYYTFPKHLTSFQEHKASEVQEHKFKIFIWWKSNRDYILIKRVIKNLNLYSDDFEFFITSDETFSNIKNCHVYNFLSFWNFTDKIKNCDLNLILNQDSSINSWDSTLLLWYAFWIPWMSNTKNKYSLKYLKDWVTWYSIKDLSDKDIVNKIISLKDNKDLLVSMKKNAYAFFLQELTMESLVNKIFNSEDFF